jgi:hypothetical protein
MTEQEIINTMCVVRADVENVITQLAAGIQDDAELSEAADWSRIHVAWVRLWRDEQGRRGWAARVVPASASAGLLRSRIEEAFLRRSGRAIEIVLSGL